MQGQETDHLRLGLLGDTVVVHKSGPALGYFRNNVGNLLRFVDDLSDSLLVGHTLGILGNSHLLRECQVIGSELLGGPNVSVVVSLSGVELHVGPFRGGSLGSLAN